MIEGRCELKIKIYHAINFIEFNFNFYTELDLRTQGSERKVFGLYSSLELEQQKSRYFDIKIIMKVDILETK